MRALLAGMLHFLAAAALFTALDQECASSQPKKIGDVRDGSRSSPLHIIKLYDPDSLQILKNDASPMPFSTRFTCGECHSYDAIRRGLHFNAHDTAVDPGRPGEPDIYVDWRNVTVIPLSYRAFPGAFRPGTVSLTTMHYLDLFGAHSSGGGIGEIDSLQSREDYFRWEISGHLEINCLGCHDADPRYDPAEYSSQVQRENYRWAPTGASEMARVKGNAGRMPDNFDRFTPLTYADIDRRMYSPPAVSYDPLRFDSTSKVFFNISRKARTERCYFCHSSVYADESYGSQWKEDEDVHVSRGMACADCHTNGLDHDMVRGYRSEASERGSPSLRPYTCEGCHIAGKDNAAGSGRFGAPVPLHKGIPPVHFEELECTVCHSGKEPAEKAALVKTSRAHRLGLRSSSTEPELFPHVQSPVYVRNTGGRIEPHDLIWPSYWGRKRGGEVTPLGVEEVRDIPADLIRLDTLLGYGRWHQLTDSAIAAVLGSFREKDSLGGQYVLVTGGKVFSLEGGKLRATDHGGADYYSWAFAHAVRPASRALGANGCSDCHSLTSDFFFGGVRVESSARSESDTLRDRVDFIGEEGMFQKVFSLTFFFRPLLKLTMVVLLLIIGLVFVIYTSKGVLLLTERAASDDEGGGRDV